MRPRPHLLALFLALAGCGPAQLSLPNDVHVGAPAPLIVRNDSTEVLCYLFVTPTSESERGLDLLDVDDVIAPGEERPFQVPEGPHRIELLDCNLGVVFSRPEVLLGPDGTHIWFRSRE